MELLSVMVKKYSLINPNGSNTSLASNEAFLSGETVACVKLQKIYMRQKCTILRLIIGMNDKLIQIFLSFAKIKALLTFIMSSSQDTDGYEFTLL